MKLEQLIEFYDRTLALDAFRADHSNNGLQYEGKPEVAKAAFAVDAAQATIDAAVAAKADILFVHHGLSWGAEPRRFTGVTAKRLGALCRSGLSLYAAHLPLDAHPTLGNNAGLAAMAGLLNLAPCCCYDGVDIGFAGDLPAPAGLRELASLYEKKLDCRATLLEAAVRPIRRAVVVSGGGGMAALDSAMTAKADLLITGELTHVMYHFAREYGVSVLALGHYASETVGVQAVMRLTAAEFGIECSFINLPTGL
jgi:dinuclear metal center YbgI/SA1388 family protein